MFSVIQLPGSNDDRDLRFALKAVLGAEARLVWHKEPSCPPARARCCVPGGFSYGDYLRCGAMARFSPIMARGDALRRRGRARARHLQRLPDPVRGGPAARRAACATATSTSCASSCTCASRRGARRSPRARGRAACCGCRSSTARAPTTRRPSSSPSSRRNGQVVLRYVRRARAARRPAANPNGSLANIAGIAQRRAAT